MRKVNWDWVLVIQHGHNVDKHRYSCLFTAICGLIRHYMSKKRGTMDFSLVQVRH